MFIHPESCGYNLHYRVLNAKHYGLPQNRERVFLIGIRPDLPNAYAWPKLVVLKHRLIDLLEDVVDEKYYLSDEMLAKISDNGKFINQDTQSSQIHNVFGCVPAVSAGTHGYSMGYVPELKKLYHSTHEANRIYDSIGIAKTQKANGGGGGTKTGYYPISDLGHKHKQLINNPNGIAQAIIVGSNGSGSHKATTYSDNRIRRLTPLETMRLQGFPDSFIKPCSETQTYKQAGNSIPVHLMKAVLKPLLHLLENS